MTSDIQVKQDIKVLLDSDALKRSLEKSFATEGKRVAFRTSVLSLVNTNPKIAECEPLSVINACLQASTLDLPVNQNLGFAYVIPYKQKDGTSSAQFQLGYKGFRQLAIRSGQFKRINVSDVREGELRSINRLTGEIDFQWEIDNDKRNELKNVGFVAYFILKSGLEDTLYMTEDELFNHGKKYSQTFKSDKDWIRKSSKWETDFEAMAKKTVLKLLLSRSAPLSVEMQQAIEYDQAVVTPNGSAEYPDNTPETLGEMQVRKEQDRIREWIEKSDTIEKLDQVMLFDQSVITDELNTLYEAKLAELTSKTVKK
jgi:recombination protein RecT